MEYRCVGCEAEWPEEYLANMRDRIFRGKKSPDLVLIDGMWYHRYCATEDNPEKGMIVKIKEPVVEDINEREEEDTMR